MGTQSRILTLGPAMPLSGLYEDEGDIYRDINADNTTKKETTLVHDVLLSWFPNIDLSVFPYL